MLGRRLFQSERQRAGKTFSRLVTRGKITLEAAAHIPFQIGIGGITLSRISGYAALSSFVCFAIDRGKIFGNGVLERMCIGKRGKGHAEHGGNPRSIDGFIKHGARFAIELM